MSGLVRVVRLLIGVALMAVMWVSAPLGTPLAQAAAKVPITVSPSKPIRGEQFTITGTLPTQVVRPVALQRKQGSKWVQVAAGDTDGTGHFQLAGVMSAQKVKLRLQAVNTTVAGQALPQLTSASKTLTAAKQRAKLGMPTSSVVGGSVKASVQLSPTRPGRSLALQVKQGARWVTVGTGTESANGRTVFQLALKTAGKLTYRAVAAPANGAPSVTSNQVKLKIKPALKIKTASLPAGTLGKGYKATLTASGGSTPYRWKARGLPAGISLAARTGKLTGTPKLVGSYTPTITVTDHTSTTVTSHLLVRITGGTSPNRAAQIAAGWGHTCALTRAGTVKCWGFNDYGELGDGTTTERHTPVAVVGLGSGVTAITAGVYHVCALTGAGAVKCWGMNGNSQLGDGTTTERHTPVAVVGLGSGVTAITAGGAHTCALTGAGTVKCWGGNDHGQLGDGTTTDRSTPVDVAGLNSAVTAIAAGGSQTCALTATGIVKCWGANSYSQLGDGTTTDWSVTPVDVSGLGSGAAAIAVGTGHACALTATGAAKCWGDDSEGQLGDNAKVINQNESKTPVSVIGLSSGVTAISAGRLHTCALSGAGAAKCWGLNRWVNEASHGSDTPVDVAGLDSGVTGITAGWMHTCAVTGAGAVKCWGTNETGELGNGTTTGTDTPVSVVGFG